jgi:hypothetical protein
MEHAMIFNPGIKTKFYITIFILILAFVIYSLMYPVRYGVQYFLSYSDEKVDDKLTQEYAQKLMDAGIVEITNRDSILKSKSNIVFYMDYTKYAKDDYYIEGKLKNAWLTFDGKDIKFVGETKLNPLKTNTKYDEYDAAYLAGKETLEVALNHIENIKHQVLREQIKLSKQKSNWGEASQS